MAATAAQIAELRRMIAEPTTTTYSDALLTSLIDAHAVPDSRGMQPTELDYTTTPPSYTTNASWIETYDLNATAAQIWEEKAAGVAADYAVTADGSILNRNQVYQQYMRIAARYRSKACMGSITAVVSQRERTLGGSVVETAPIIDRSDNDVVFNASDEDDL